MIPTAPSSLPTWLHSRLMGHQDKLWCPTNPTRDPIATTLHTAIRTWNTCCFWCLFPCHVPNFAEKWEGLDGIGWDWMGSNGMGSVTQWWHRLCHTSVSLRSSHTTVRVLPSQAIWTTAPQLGRQVVSTMSLKVTKCYGDLIISLTVSGLLYMQVVDIQYIHPAQWKLHDPVQRCCSPYYSEPDIRILDHLKLNILEILLPSKSTSNRDSPVHCNRTVGFRCDQMVPWIVTW